jgi:serine/threonine protein kinase
MEHITGFLVSDMAACNKGMRKKEPIAAVCKAMLPALQYLHAKNIIHRDIKGDNIFLDSNGELKLIDFGLSFKYNVEVKPQGTHSGTADFLAPELVRRELFDHGVDIWALGIVVLELFNGGRTPYYAYDEDKVKELIRKDGKPPVVHGVPRSKRLYKFVKECHVINLHERPNATKLLEHDFIGMAASKEDMKTLYEEGTVLVPKYKKPDSPDA